MKYIPLDDKHCIINSDKTYVNQILTNLINNAIRGAELLSEQ